MSLVQQDSISQIDWIDYIFTSSQKIVRCLTTADIVGRRRGYLWYKMKVEQQSEDLTIESIALQTEMQWYQNVQRIKWFIWKLRGRCRDDTQLINDCDLMGDEITADTNVLTLTTKNGIIRYTVDDLVGLLKMYLEKRDQFTTTPVIPKHPYTNKEWSMGDMHAVQGWLRRQTIPMSMMQMSVFIWLKTPYVVQTLFDGNSIPYLQGIYGKFHSIYSFNLEDSDRDTQLVYFSNLVRRVGINPDDIDWTELNYLEDDVWESNIMPLVHLWQNPLSKWLVQNRQMRDHRESNWRRDIMERLKALNCLIYLDNRRTFVRRSRNRRRRIELR